jgi:O-antigen ligase
MTSVAHDADRFGVDADLDSARPRPAARAVRPQAVHRVLQVGCMIAIAWGALAFGAVYPWAFTSLAAGCAGVGLAALIVERRGRPALAGLAAGFAAILLAISLQLVRLPLSTLLRVSPATDAFLVQYDFRYQLARATDANAGTGGQLRQPISIAPEKTTTGVALLAAFAVFLLGMSRLLSAVGAKTICRWVVAFGGVLALVGIAQRAFTATEIRPLIYGFWQPRSEAQPFGPFVNPNHFAGWMLMGLPLALVAFLDAMLAAIDAAPRKGNRIALLSSPQFGAVMMLGTTCLVMGLALIMTRSRSGMAAFAVGAVMAGTIAFRRQSMGRAKLAVASAVGLLLIATLAWAGLDTATSKFTERQAPKSLALRLGAWRDTVRIIRDFPWTGSGFDTYGTAMMIYQTEVDRSLHFREAHNDYLQLAAEGGVLVGVPVLATLAVFVRAVRRRFREAPTTGTTYYLRVGAVVGLVAVALQSLVEFSLQLPGNVALFALLAAIALHQSPNLPLARR